MKMPSERVRAYIYRVLIAVGAVVAGYGWLTTNEIALWVGLAGVILNILPTANTTTKIDE
jgi:hypothetical protein